MRSDSGGAALALARAGCRVAAIDAAPGMVARIRARAAGAGLGVDAQMMDAAALRFDDNVFDAALSIFGIVLVPDAVRALAEMRRVVRPGGIVAVVTWTEPQRYALAARLGAAIAAEWPARPAAALPAQLRFRERAAFVDLFRAAGCGEPAVETVEATLEAENARALAARIAFAPGMAAMLDGLGDRRAAVLARFVDDLERDQGRGQVRLPGVAFVGTARIGSGEARR